MLFRSFGAVAVAGCTTNATTGQLELDPAVVDAVQSAVANIAKYIPTVESIITTAATLFPAYGTVVQIGTAAFNTLVQALTSIVTGLTQAQSARLAARLRASSSAAPVVVGTTAGGVVITGYRL